MMKFCRKCGVDTERGWQGSCIPCLYDRWQRGQQNRETVSAIVGTRKYCGFCNGITGRVGGKCEYASDPFHAPIGVQRLRPDTLQYVYATLLPGGVVKIGMGSGTSRATAAQMYYIEPCEVLAVWPTEDPALDIESLAHEACARWRVRGELFVVTGDWLAIPHDVVDEISAVLGPSMSYETLRRTFSQKGKRR